MIEYEILKIGPVLGSPETFAQVAYWYEGRVEGQDPDLVHEFRVAIPTTSYQTVRDRLGQMKTATGKWLPPVHEVDGEWVPYPSSGPPDDPWALVEVQVDPSAFFIPLIESVGINLRAKGVRGVDRFRPGEVLVDPRPMKNLNHAAARMKKDVGLRGTVRRAR